METLRGSASEFFEATFYCYIIQFKLLLLKHYVRQFNN